MDSQSTSSDLYATVSHNGGWEIMNSEVTQDIHGIFFICLNRGTVVGEEGLVLRSGDGGNTWILQTTGVTDNLAAVSYYGYTITLAVGENGTLLLTNNSGLNWTVLQTGISVTYYSCQMINETIGVAVGVNGINQPFFTRTINGWRTWDSTSFYLENNSVSYEGQLSDVTFLNSSLGFATAIVNEPPGGAIVQTTDGGLSWETVYFSDEALFSLDFSDGQVGCAVGTHGTIVRTLDGGNTWHEGETGVYTTLRGIDFFYENTGTIVGDNGLILRSENQGLSWRPQTSGTTEDLLGVYFVTNLFGFAVGTNGLILRTQTGGYPKDTMPPVTTCSLSGIMEGGIYLSDVMITLNATDNISGVATTVYTLDEAPWETYHEPFIVNGNGNHHLRFYSIDYVGNMEQEKTSEFIIHYPPNLSLTLTGGIGIHISIQNLESENLTNITWNLTIEGGLIFLGKQQSRTITIQAHEQIMLHCPIFGFGRPKIHFTIASHQEHVQSRIFFFFVRIVA